MRPLKYFSQVSYNVNTHTHTLQHYDQTYTNENYSILSELIQLVCGKLLESRDTFISKRWPV